MADARLRHVDVLRGIAILCIVFGHLNLGAVNHFVFTFHVPVFFLITGYFLSAKAEVGVFMKIRARTLLVPYLVTALVMILLAGLIVLAKGQGGDAALGTMKSWSLAALYGAGSTDYLPAGVQPIGMVWFLLASFWACVLLRLLLKVKWPIQVLVVAVLAFVCCWSAQRLFLPWSIQPAGVALMYMYLGHLWRLAKPKVDAWPPGGKVALACLAFLGWAVFLWLYSGVYIVEADFSDGFPDIPGTLCACFSVLLIAKGIDRVGGVVARGLAFCGRYSLFVLCAHAVENGLFYWTGLIAALAGMGMPLLLAQVLALACKLVWILGWTVLLSRFSATRKLFGFRE